MATLLKSLLGNGSKDAELTAEVRTAVQEMRQERSHCETLVKSARASLNRVQELGEPINEVCLFSRRCIFRSAMAVDRSL